MAPKRRRNNTAVKATPPPLPYHEDAQSPNEAVAPDEDIDYSASIKVKGLLYWRTKALTAKQLSMLGTSAVWKFDRGFSIIAQSDKKAYYYCRKC
jgi:hypothetical protein